MKYIESSSLETLNAALACVDTGDTRVFGRLELYSCKNTKQDVLLQRKLETKATLHSPSSISPTRPSPLGKEEISRKTLFYLRATLNAAFPDYDFSDIKDDTFHHISPISLVVNEVNTCLFNMGNDRFAQIAGDAIWQGIAEEIATPLNDCDVYAFRPSTDEFDEGEGTVWSFYYFFFSKKQKRMVLFTCRAVSFMAPMQYDELEENTMMEDSGGNLSRQNSQDRGLSYEQYTMAAMDI